MLGSDLSWRLQLGLERVREKCLVKGWVGCGCGSGGGLDVVEPE